MDRKEDNLQQLGHAVEYRMDYAPEVLETFENRHPDNDYWVEFLCPEFTTLCPITGQPDFAEIRILYIPDRRMVESKSLKLYLFSFRNHGDFHEDCVNIIMKDLVPTPVGATVSEQIFFDEKEEKVCYVKKSVYLCKLKKVRKETRFERNN